jgi:hypothetical protein
VYVVMGRGRRGGESGVILTQANALSMEGHLPPLNCCCFKVLISLLKITSLLFPLNTPLHNTLGVFSKYKLQQIESLRFHIWIAAELTEFLFTLQSFKLSYSGSVIDSACSEFCTRGRAFP